MKQEEQVTDAELHAKVAELCTWARQRGFALLVVQMSGGTSQQSTQQRTAPRAPAVLETTAEIVARALDEHASAFTDIALRLERRIADAGLPEKLLSPALVCFQDVVRAGLRRALVEVCPCNVCRLTTEALGPLVDAACARLNQDLVARAAKKGPEA